MTDSRPNPNDLLFAHQYADALRLCNSMLERGDDVLGAHGTRATVLLCLGRFDEALSDTKVVEDEEQQIPGLRTSLYPIQRGVLLWLQGNRQEAARAFQEATTGVRSDTIQFADQAGGGSQGLLLHFAAITMGADDAMREADSYLTWLSKRKRIVSWPGALVLHVIGKLSVVDVLAKEFGTADLGYAITIAKNNLLRRRSLAQALFHFGMVRKRAGDESGCREYLDICCSLENPIVEYEWYLAHEQLGRTWY
jgi:hypothetical protein